MLAAQACGTSVSQVGDLSGSTGSGDATGSTGGEPTTVMCGAHACASGEACCMTTAQCYDPVAAPEACPTPDMPPNPQGQSACSSSAQCAPDEFCNPGTASLCLTQGYCTPKANCGSSSGGSFCGCDGVTYPDIQTACLAGVHVIGFGACGAQGEGGGSPTSPVVYCGNADVCPDGQDCCAITGKCYDPAEPGLCAYPPPGASLPCLENADCPSTAYCKREGCDGPGGCFSLEPSCPGDLDPVCGCDGKTYVNAQCAGASATSVAHEGECAP
jgi:hypothetical protein